MTWSISSGVASASFLPIRSTDSVRTWLIFTHERFGKSGELSSSVSGSQPAEAGSRARGGVRWGGVRS